MASPAAIEKSKAGTTSETACVTLANAPLSPSGWCPRGRGSNANTNHGINELTIISLP
jgi:hypothetical protein